MPFPPAACSGTVLLMRKHGSDMIWPEFVTSVRGLIERAVIVRFACMQCREIFDVDLQAVVTVRGPAYSLMDRSSTCRRSRCRGQGFFVMATAIDAPFAMLAYRAMPSWLRGIRPCDVEPPLDDGSPPRCPNTLPPAEQRA